jgi:histidine ammonia-lyase
MQNPGKGFSPNGSNLGVTRLVRFAKSDSAQFEIPQAARIRIEESRKIVDQAIDRGEPVYGLTTGLGARADETLTRQQLTDFSLRTLQGRAQSMGSPLPMEIVRGAMVIRVNTMMSGASGGSARLADFLVACLNRNLTPVVGELGSIGVGDLCLGATMGLAFTGEGQMSGAAGKVDAASAVLENENISPLVLAPKDGLVIASHACFSASSAAFAVDDANRQFKLLQACAALTMQAVRANLSPVNDAVTMMSQHRAHRIAAAQLRTLLDGSTLEDPAKAARVQDPLSIRNVVQVHGSLLSALMIARSTVNAELNSVTDNPVVDIPGNRVVSSGGYFSAELTMCLEALARSLDMAITTQLARLSKLASTRFSGLPQFLARPSTDSNGFAPVLKIAEALVGQIKRELAPVDLWPSINADGVEDVLSNAFERAQSLKRALLHARRLSAIEMIMAAQGLELSGQSADAPENILSLLEATRTVVASLDQDRPLGGDIENLAQAMSLETFPLVDHAGK